MKQTGNWLYNLLCSIQNCTQYAKHLPHKPHNNEQEKPCQKTHLLFHSQNFIKQAYTFNIENPSHKFYLHLLRYILILTQTIKNQISCQNFTNTAAGFLTTTVTVLHILIEKFVFWLSVLKSICIYEWFSRQTNMFNNLLTPSYHVLTLTLCSFQYFWCPVTISHALLEQKAITEIRLTFFRLECKSQDGRCSLPGARM